MPSVGGGQVLGEWKAAAGCLNLDSIDLCDLWGQESRYWLRDEKRDEKFFFFVVPLRQLRRMFSVICAASLHVSTCFICPA